MNRPSDRLDFVDKMMDLRNLYLESQKCIISSEIVWLDEHYEDIQSLRQYFLVSLRMERAARLSDKAIQDLAITYFLNSVAWTNKK